MSKAYNVMSLFDGARMGLCALKRAGVKVSWYSASEICENAISIANDNYPGCENLGDVTKWKEWDISWGDIDLLIGGSPCQGFSICGNRLEFSDERSALIQCYFDILNHIKSVNPDVKFMLENVKMSSECEIEISKQLGVDAMRINSKLVSAQMRDRLYWFNWDVKQPINKPNILLEDIIENGYVEKDKAWCMLESWNRFPTSMESARGRYKRSMMPIVFFNKSCSFEDGWRELTIHECELLQGVPPGYTKAIHPKRAKGVLGNGWQVDTVAHIFKGLIKGSNNEK